MSKIEELENQVRELSRAELIDFRNWLDDFEQEIWDGQFESDAQDGKLLSLAERSLRQHRSGESTPL